MGVGKHIKKLRESKTVDGKKLSLRKLAEMAHISPSFLSDIERGKTEPSLDTLRKIAAALGCTPGELLDGIDVEPDSPPEQEKSHVFTDIIFVPVMSDINTVCCGEGNIYAVPEETIEYMIPAAAAALGPICTEGLFAVKANGDSMTGAKIHEGDLVVVAPHEEPFNGSVVFVCYGPQKRWMLRWYYARHDGTILLRAANPTYPDIEVSKGDIESGWYEYVGRVVTIISTPRVGL